MQRALSYVSVILVVLFLFLPANAAEEGGGAYYDLGVFISWEKPILKPGVIRRPCII